MKKLLVLVSVMALVVFGAGLAFAGEWHTSNNNLCTDCHTMHFSQSHNWDGTTPVLITPQANGNWLSATGPNVYLLKAPVNQLCLACHNGQTFAPDVLEDNTNVNGLTQGRSAGALNEVASAIPYETWKGHTLGVTDVPPGYDPTQVGLSATWYNNANGLECTSCHTQHGIAGVYRNLGPRSLGTANLPSYVIGTTNDTTKDVWINISAPYVVNSGDPATFNQYYDNAKTAYNRLTDKTVGLTTTSNGLDTMCASCHGKFHGGGGNAGSVGGTGTPSEGFIRHPTSATTIGQLGSGHSTLTRYTSATTKVKTYSNNVDYTDASPGCVSCHKSHGNQNPFGLIFLNRNATSVGEQGGYAAGQVELPNGYQIGYRNLCGQCHSQGSN